MGNSPSHVPFSSQINLVNIALDCYSGPNRAHSTIEFSLSLTAPLIGGSGQQIYFSDIAPTVYLPSFDNPSFFGGNASINLDLSNAAQPYVNVAGPISIKGGANAQLLSAGPVVLGQQGIANRYYLGETNLTIANVETGLRRNQADHVKNCPAPPRPSQVIIGAIVVDSSTGPPLRPSTGGNAGFSNTPAGSKATVANVPLTSCLVGHGTIPSNQSQFNLTLGAVQPVVLNIGQNFSITKLTNFVTIPQAVAKIFTGLYDSGDSGYSFIDLSLQNDSRGNPAGPGYGWSIANAVPGTVDVAYNFVATDSNDTPAPLHNSWKVQNNATGDVVIPLPLDGSLSIGPFVAGQSGDVFSVDVTRLAGEVGGYNVDEMASEGELNWACDTLAAFELFSVPIL